MSDLPWALRHQPDLLKLAIGQGVSAFGSQITLLALPLTAVAVLGASPVEMGVLGAAQLSPFLLLGLFAGAWVDRMRRRPILIAADLGRAALLGSIPVAMLLGVAYAMIPLAAALRSEAVVLLVIVAGLSGLGGTIYNIGYNIGLLSLRQSATPDHLLGRVSGTMQFLMCGARCRSAHC